MVILLLFLFFFYFNNLFQSAVISCLLNILSKAKKSQFKCKSHETHTHSTLSERSQNTELILLQAFYVYCFSFRLNAHSSVHYLPYTRKWQTEFKEARRKWRRRQIIRGERKWELMNKQTHSPTSDLLSSKSLHSLTIHRKIAIVEEYSFFWHFFSSWAQCAHTV